MPVTNPLTYREAEPLIRTGDVLLHRPRDLFGRLIATLGRSEYSHAGMACWDGLRVSSLETIQFRGGVQRPLEELVEEKPGAIDVYTVLCTTARQRQQAAAGMRQIVGRRYGWLSLLELGLVHAPLLRLLLPRNFADQADSESNGWRADRLPFCSMAVDRAYMRWAGVDLVPNLHSRYTEPGDLARTARLDYLCTLIPQE